MLSRPVAAYRQERCFFAMLTLILFGTYGGVQGSLKVILGHLQVVTVEPSLGLDKREEQSIMEDGAGDFTCAICLNEIDLPELAMVKGCEHVYCGKRYLYVLLLVG